MIFEHPDRVKQVAIRQLSPQEHVLSHGTTTALTQPEHYPDTPTVYGRDGYELLDAWRAQQADPEPVGEDNPDGMPTHE